MKITEKLYENVREIWEGYHNHPFVCGIADGSLSIERFQFYMIQDYLYLFEYAKVFALGVVKSDNHENMKMFSSSIDTILNGEMKIHCGYMKKLGISEDEADNTVMSLANRSYTEYMISVGFRGDELDILAAILACSWSYQQIGKRIAEQNPSSLKHEFYGAWVEGYSSKEYEEANLAIMNLMDSLAENCTQKQVERLTEIFVNCSRYEAMFWDMSWDMEF